MGPLARMVDDAGYADRAEMVRAQARLAVAGAAAAGILDADMRELRERARHDGIDA